jgi:4-hydroxythreonine-4-phosphate dehydrogenase
MTQTIKPRIGITLGDVNGIGPEVVIKALADNRVLNMITPVVYGSTKAISFYKKQLNIEDLHYSQIRNKGQLSPKTINVMNCWDESLEITPGKASPSSGNAAMVALKAACEELKDGSIDALVTAPIDKSSIHSEEFPFTGHTGFLTQFFGATESLMFMVSDALKIGLVTEHIPIKDVASAITREKIEAKLAIMERSLKKDFGISKPRIAVLGLNPHAGDGGLIGQEDETVIKPAVNDSRNKGRLTYGPFPSDGFFASGAHAKYDAILAMYHDQGLLPFKTIAFEEGINFTAGLSVVRTSPDHGTAYSLAGKNQANEQSMRMAIYRAADIFKSRNEPPVEK